MILAKNMLFVLLQASEDELKVAHRRMCVLYHPDKHNDKEKKRVKIFKFCELVFSKT